VNLASSFCTKLTENWRKNLSRHKKISSTFLW